MSDALLSDGALLQRYQKQGDEAAFYTLQQRYARMVFSAALRETGDRTLAEDATQGAFLLLTRKSFSEEASLAGWLFGAVRLVAKNLLRQEQRRTDRERRAFQNPETPDEAWTLVEPHLNEALAHLRSDDREAILLRFGGELNFAEIGTRLGIGENAARMRINRALERMRTYLQRGGVGLTAMLLATVLSTRLAEASPSRSGPVPDHVSHLIDQNRGRLSLSLLPAKIWWATGAIFTSVGILAGGYVAWSAPNVLSAEETTRLFTESIGTWQGDLEYANDGDGERVKTKTTVTIRNQNGTLLVEARFPNYDVVDAMRFRPTADNRFEVTATGSHTLDGTLRLERQRDGIPAFVGSSPVMRGQVRIRLESRGTTLRIMEEYKREADWQFRNRYDLTRINPG